MTLLTNAIALAAVLAFALVAKSQDLQPDIDKLSIRLASSLCMRAFCASNQYGTNETIPADFHYQLDKLSRIEFAPDDPNDKLIHQLVTANVFALTRAIERLAMAGVDEARKSLVNSDIDLQKILPSDNFLRRRLLLQATRDFPYASDRNRMLDVLRLTIERDPYRAYDLSARIRMSRKGFAIVPDSLWKAELSLRLLQAEMAGLSSTPLKARMSKDAIDKERREVCIWFLKVISRVRMEFESAKLFLAAKMNKASTDINQPSISFLGAKRLDFNDDRVIAMNELLLAEAEFEACYPSELLRSIHAVFSATEEGGEGSSNSGISAADFRSKFLSNGFTRGQIFVTSARPIHNVYFDFEAFSAEAGFTRADLLEYFKVGVSPGDVTSNSISQEIRLNLFPWMFDP